MQTLIKATDATATPATATDAATVAPAPAPATDAKAAKRDAAKAQAKAKRDAAKAAKAANAPAPAATPATDAAKAPAPFVHTHSDAGVTGKHYAGLSSYLNANRKPRIATDGAHKYNRTTAQLTARTLGTLRAMRDAYDLKQFQARGFDNAVCAMLISAGLLRIVSGTGSTTSDAGVTYSCDGEKPLLLAVTAAGRNYGKA